MNCMLRREGRDKGTREQTKEQRLNGMERGGMGRKGWMDRREEVRGLCFGWDSHLGKVRGDKEGGGI